MLIVVGVAAGCVKRYETAEFDQSPEGAGPSFDGLAQLMQRDKQIRVLWTHGMCTHQIDWVDKRSRLLRNALGIAPESERAAAQAAPGEEAYTVRRQFKRGDNALDVNFFVWSPLTLRYKDNLLFDAPSKEKGDGFPYDRAKLNGQMKLMLLNNCLVDAVVYSGPNGDPLRHAMRKAVCEVMGGDLQEARFCHFSAEPPSTPLVFVTESLGSKMLFDAIRVLREEAQKRSQRDKTILDAQLAGLQTMFMLSNQVPLLDAADRRPMAGQGGMSIMGVRENQPEGSLNDFIAGMRQARDSRAETLMLPMLPAQTVLPTQRPLLIVAFTDPNDLLSYRLDLKRLQVNGARLVNVISSNAGTLLGYVEHPVDAHCGYKWNPEVIDILVNGYDGKPRTKPRARIYEEESCLG